MLAGSGHIAGVVNPAGKPKYQYLDRRQAGGRAGGLDRQGDGNKGSWWPHWVQWIAAQAPEKVKARKPGGRKLKPLCDAPGEYVKVRA